MNGSGWHGLAVFTLVGLGVMALMQFGYDAPGWAVFGFGLVCGTLARMEMRQ